ncbi:MAG: A24 family peptidase [Eubacterium sp.]|nr:A24 family peptidase [Eubacterium sp.]
MKSLIIKILIGVAVGVACKFIGDQLERFFLKERKLEFRRGKIEDVLVLLATGGFGIAILLRTGSIPEMIYIFLLMIVSQVITLTDFHHRVIPNESLLMIFALKIAFGVPFLFGMEKFPEFSIIGSLVGMAVSFIIFLVPAVISKQVGAGDIKLAAAMGFALGLSGSMTAIVLMGVLVIIYTILQKQTPVLEMVKTMIPMGPFLAVSMIVVLLLPDQLFVLHI